MVLFCKPRVCGEKPFLPKQHVPEPGITPAYAGKRRTIPRRRSAAPDHPRVCGEKQKKSPTGLVTRGSPPACAGKRAQYRLQRRCGWDHPRMCGEKHRSVGLPKSRVGSPPRMRGKRSAKPLHSYNSWDHPRVCGEKVFLSVPATSVLGSPPRMRGKVPFSIECGFCTGITPAYAGKSVSHCAYCICDWDHPRVCGEKCKTVRCMSDAQGSPPRMRGKGVKPCNKRVAVGITPAYAGKRLKRSRSTVPPVAIVPLFPSVCNKPVVSDGSPAVRDAPLFLPAENAVPASPAYNLRSL